MSIIRTFTYRHLLFFLICFSSLFKSAAQDFILKKGVKKQVIPFELRNNLIVFPMELNGKKLNFILDSGVGSTLLFNVNYKDSIQLNNIEKIDIQGLGGDNKIEAVISKNNKLVLKNITGINQDFYVLFHDSFDLSSKLGITIHGIIGYELLKDFVVKINYNLNRLTFYNKNSYSYKKCSKCENFDIQFFKLKPYINVGIRLNKTSNKIIPVKLLVDSGGSDTLWLFENSHPDILPPSKYFFDYLGEGLSGSITGKRSKIETLTIGKYELKKPIVAYPDSSTVSYARQFKERNGSLGSNILKRFIIIFDYPEKKISFKKSVLFSSPFTYNMSGIELVYNGKLLVKELTFTQVSPKNNRGSFSINYGFNYVFKPSYKILKVRPLSPAYYAGLLPNDILIKVNGKFAYEYKLEEIVHNFFESNSTVALIIEREGKNYEVKLELKNELD